MTLWVTLEHYGQRHHLTLAAASPSLPLTGPTKSKHGAKKKTQ